MEAGALVTRPTREAYVRASRIVLGHEVCAGLELRVGDRFDDLHAELAAAIVTSDLGRDVRGMTADDVAALVERHIAGHWPDRAYFLEVCNGDESKGWVQVYMPFGMPRIR